MATSSTRLLWIVVGLLAAGLFLPVLVAVLFGGGWGFGMGPGMMGWWRSMEPGLGGWAWPLAMLLGWLGMIAFWGAVILGVALVVRALADAGTRPSGDRETPQAILRRRYAKGEIDKATYERMPREVEA